MKYITVKLTEDQIQRIITALELDMNNDYPKSDPFNAFAQRVINKLAQAKTL